jgi:TRAP transporter TAXI family solute receptor
MIKFKKSLLLLVTSLFALTLSACGVGGGNGTANPANPGNTGDTNNAATTRINFASGTAAGSYYVFGNYLTKLWSDNSDYDSTSSESRGSDDNLLLIKNGGAETGISAIGSVYDAYHGERKFAGDPITNLRILAGTYPNVNHFMARKDAGIQSIADIKGKAFIPGANPSATLTESEHTLEVYGMSLREDTQSTYGSLAEATESLRSKQIDATVMMVGEGTATIGEITTTANGIILSYDEEAIVKLQELYPWTMRYTIPAGTYDNQDYDVQTIAQQNAIVIAAEIPDDVVYELTRIMWENIDTLAKLDPNTFGKMTLAAATDDIVDIPLHPGAIRYYEEQGMTIDPANLPPQ